MEDSEGELGPSVLGNKSYWEDAYQRELHCFKESGDCGHVWFGENSVERVVNWLLKCPELNSESPILDIGCGNGNVLMSLAENGFKNLSGIDYSDNAIDLAKEISEAESLDINYQVSDYLSWISNVPEEKYSVLIDKGTYDAISLSDDKPKEKRRDYVEVANNILHSNGFFVMTTCNWTEEEITNHFSKYFKVHLVLPTRKIQFGGKTGNDVTCVIFKKSDVGIS